MLVDQGSQAAMTLRALSAESGLSDDLHINKPSINNIVAVYRINNVRRQCHWNCVHHCDKYWRLECAHSLHNLL